MYNIMMRDLYTNEEALIHTATPGGLKVINGKIKQNLYGIDEFDFTVGIDNVAFHNADEIRTIIEVTGLHGERYFTGRIVKPTLSMSSDGKVNKTFYCESVLAFLHDTTQDILKIHNKTVSEFYNILLERHNKIAAVEKRFVIGKCDVTNSTDNLFREVDYTTTYDALKDKLLTRLGGFLTLRKENDSFVLDYLTDRQEIGDVFIELGSNMQSLTKELDLTEMKTVIVPLGARIEKEEGANENEVGQVEERINIAEVNSGKKYLEDNELIKQFGKIEGYLMFDDVHDKNILKIKGEQFLKNQKIVMSSFSINALNLSLLAKEYSDFEIGKYYKVNNTLLGISEYVQLIEREIDLFKPQGSTLTFGKKQLTISEYQAQMIQSKKDADNLKNIVSGQQNSLKDLNNAVKEIDLSGINDKIENVEKDKPSRFEIYTQTQVNELLKKYAALKDLENYVKKEDTGWLAVSSSTLFARCKNGVVEIDGYLNIGAGAAGTNLNVSLPKGIPTPTRTRYIRVDSINNKERSCMLILRTNGIININNGNIAPVSDNYSFIDSYTP